MDKTPENKTEPEAAKEEVKEKAPRFFDAAEYTAKLDAALEKLKAEKKPGEVSGKVGKAEILKSGVLKMQALLDKGFTLKQISDAISEDVFGIMPKSLTETLTGKKAKPVKRNRKAGEAASAPSGTPDASNAAPAATPATAPAAASGASNAAPAAVPAAQTAQQNKPHGKTQITQIGDMP